MSNSWMVEALAHIGYTVRFTRRLGHWRIVVSKDYKVVLDMTGISESHVIRKAYYKLVDPEPEMHQWENPETERKVKAACEAAHDIVAAWKAVER